MLYGRYPFKGRALSSCTFEHIEDVGWDMMETTLAAGSMRRGNQSKDGKHCYLAIVCQVSMNEEVGFFRNGFGFVRVACITSSSECLFLLLLL